MRKDDQIVDAVRTLVHANRFIKHDCEEAGVTLAQYRILDFIRLEPARAGELASKAAISRPSLTTIMDTLESRALIRRDRVPGDRRGVTLELTDAGLEALLAVEDAFENRFVKTLNSSELRTVMTGLGVLRDVMMSHIAQAEAET